MHRQLLIVSCLALVSITSAAAAGKWFWKSGIGCEPMDQACLLDYAVEELDGMTEDASVNTYGKTLGQLWPHLDDETRQKLINAYLEQADGNLVLRYLNIARATIPPATNAEQLFSDLLDDPTLTGALPIEYWGETLASAVLKSNPVGAADLAIARGDAFSDVAIDGLFRTIAWMARNDMDRLQTYLDAHDPKSTGYFSPGTHLFRIAGELCEDGQNGMLLAKIALADLLRQRIAATERFAKPTRAIIGCEGYEAASANLENMFRWLSEDLERQKARGNDGAFMIQRIVKAVNDDGLAPVIQWFHDAGRIAEAEAVAERLLPEPQVVISLDEGKQVSIEKSQVQAQLAEILEKRSDLSHNIDPATALRWFTTSFDPEDHFNPADFAVRAIDPILDRWPDPLAQEALEIALPLLASSKYTPHEKLRLQIGLASARSGTCVLDEPALQALLDEIADQEQAATRIDAIASYLTYLGRFDPALPVCTT